MNTLVEKIQTVVKNPEFQRNAIRTTGSVVALVAGMAASRLTHKVIDTGIEKLISKYIPEVVEVVTTAVEA